MKIIRIEKEQIEYFRWLDPYDYLERIMLPGYFAIGVCETNENEDEPRGLMVCFRMKDAIVIEWFCVDPKHRYEQAGDLLLRKAFEMAQHLGKEWLHVLLPKDGELKEISGAAQSYFMEREFERSEQSMGQYTFNVAEAQESDWIKDSKNRPKTVALKNVLNRDYHAFINNIPEYGKNWQHTLLDACQKEQFEPDISRAIMFEQEICGLFLVQKTERGIWTLFFYSESQNETKALVVDALSKVRSMYGLDMPMHVLAMQEDAVALMNRIFPEKMIPVELFSARVSDFFDKIRLD